MNERLQFEIRYGKKIAKTAMVYELKLFPFEKRCINPIINILRFISSSLFLRTLLLVQESRTEA